MYIKEKYRLPLLIFGILLILMGIWIIIRTNIVQAKENDDYILNKKVSLNFQLIKKDVKKKIDRSLTPISIRDGKNLFSMEIPSFKNKPLISSGVLVDVDSMKIIWSLNPYEVGEIASMTKIMLMLATFNLIDSGYISLSDTVYVTDEAPLMGGSQAYLDRGERYSVDELLKAIAVGSANDAAYLLAHFIGNDDVVKAIDYMNSIAQRLELKNTKFYNVHGLPPTRNAVYIKDGIGKQKFKRRDLIVATKANTSTPIEMAKLGVLFCKFPELLKYTNIVADSVWDLDLKRPQTYLLNNHFRPISKDYIDGIKTGFTCKAGYCVTASALKNNRRLIAVVFNCQSEKLRDKFVVNLFDEAYKSLGIYDNVDTVRAGNMVKRIIK